MCSICLQYGAWVWANGQANEANQKERPRSTAHKTNRISVKYKIIKRTVWRLSRLEFIADSFSVLFFVELHSEKLLFARPKCDCKAARQWTRNIEHSTDIIVCGYAIRFQLNAFFCYTPISSVAHAFKNGFVCRIQIQNAQFICLYKFKW